MVEQAAPQDNVQFLLGDFNTRLRDSDERSRLIRERVLLLGKNLISSRQDIEDELAELKRDSAKMGRDIDELKRMSKRVVEEIGKFVKREEMVGVERRLKDFEPLEFVRRKDVEEMINSSKAKEIKREVVKK